MTEEEWLAATDPTPMLEFIRDKTSSRKWRLFACVTARRLPTLMADEPSRCAIEIAEKYADGIATEQEVEITRTEMQKGVEELVSQQDFERVSIIVYAKRCLGVRK